MAEGKTQNMSTVLFGMASKTNAHHMVDMWGTHAGAGYTHHVTPHAIYFRLHGTNIGAVSLNTGKLLINAALPATQATRNALKRLLVYAGTKPKPIKTSKQSGKIAWHLSFDGNTFWHDDPYMPSDWLTWQAQGGMAYANKLKHMVATSHVLDTQYPRQDITQAMQNILRDLGM